MRVAARWADSTLTLDLAAEERDGLIKERARLTGTSVRFRVGVPLGPDDVHPDVEALLALLVVQPFSGPSVTLSRGVSTGFATAVDAAFGKQLAPIDPSLDPRRAPTPGLVGLAYSAGADSTAALAVLPPDAVAFFLRRADPPGGRRPSLYSDAAALHAVGELERRGRQVRVVESNVERVRDPVGFTSDWVTGAGAILLAERERLDSLAWGLVAESAYRIGHEHYLDWGERQRAGWGPVFAAAGLPMCQVVAGVSEVGTAAIVRRAPEGDLAQSCIRGTVGRPCRNCWKCFRKLLLDAALSDDWPGAAELDRLFRVRDARKMLAKYPIKHEDVVAWTAGRYRGDHHLMLLLKARTRAEDLDLDWLTRFYGPSLDLLPAQHRPMVAANLARYLDRMTAQDEAVMRAWDMAPLLADPKTEAARDRLVAALRAHKSSDVPRLVAIFRRVYRRMRG